MIGRVTPSQSARSAAGVDQTSQVWSRSMGLGRGAVRSPLAPSIAIKSPAEFEAMRAAGRVAALALGAGVRACVQGVTTREIDQIVSREIRAAGAEAVFEGYRQSQPTPFPATTCISINEEVVHGVPGDRIVRAGDLVSIDVGVRLRGWCADTATTILVAGAEGSPQATEQLRVRSQAQHAARRTLATAVSMMRPGALWSHIAAAMQDEADRGGYGLVRDYVGHGIGRDLHESPRVPAFAFGSDGADQFEDFMLEAGMTLAVEPILTVPRTSGARPSERTEVIVLSDGWTVATKDRSIACHEEHTIGVTERGAEILTGV